MPAARTVQTFLLLLVANHAIAAGLTIVVTDPDGAAGRVASPVSMGIDLTAHFGNDVDPRQLRMSENKDGPSLPVQFVADTPDLLQGTLWWLMPPGTQGQCRFLLTVTDKPVEPAGLKVSGTAGQCTSDKWFDVTDGDLPVLRYSHGNVPVPDGIPERYARGDYISLLYGPEGELLTDDYPRDHPHHRAVSWSWPVTRFGDEVRDIWAVVGVWARPTGIRRLEAGPVMALIEAESVWKWGDKKSIVQEQVLIRAFRQNDRCRFIDVEVRLKALADRVAIGGRPHGGYGGFSLRAQSVEQQAITAHVDPAEARPRRSWLDYSGLFDGGRGTTGLTIFEHVTNPGYPSELKQYPNLNCVMPAFPGEREVPLHKDKWLVLKHRLWIHDGGADEKKLTDVWTGYAEPPKVAIAK